jgi:8-oxo-dGTP pyrophosphatase MutT (NUDIX family)
VSVQYTDDQGFLVSPFYRVAVRAIVRDEQQRVLVLESKSHHYELPGGGWEHDESLETCLQREFSEECGVEVTNIGDVWFVYRGWGDGWKHWHLRVVVPASIKTMPFTFRDEDFIAARFVEKDEFLQLPWSEPDQKIVDHVDKLWPPVENPTLKQ